MNKLITIVTLTFFLASLTTVSFAESIYKKKAAHAVSTTSAAAATPAKKIEEVMGRIQSIDTARNQIIIAGKTISIDPAMIKKLKVGEEAKITLKEGTMKAQDIKLAMPNQQSMPKQQY